MSVYLPGITTPTFYQRTANLPDDTAFTICGWAQKIDASSSRHTLCALADAASSWSAGLALTLDNDDNDTIVITGDGIGDTNVAAVGSTSFFWALTGSGIAANTFQGHIRLATANSLTTAQGPAGRSAFTPAALLVGYSGYSPGYWDGRIWNVKCWDRALTTKELLIESFYERVQFPSSLNFHWKLRNTSDTQDYSGNGRTPTLATGTPVTAPEPYKIWIPSKRFAIPFATAGGGGTENPLSHIKRYGPGRYIPFGR